MSFTKVTFGALVFVLKTSSTKSVSTPISDTVEFDGLSTETSRRVATYDTK